MSTQTEHYQLSLREGTDIFNPLSTNDNFEKIDELLFQGASGGVATGTPVVSGGTLSFQGLTLVAGDTVVKFKLDSSQSVNQVTFAGSTIAIVDLSGANKTLTGGFWIGYVDTNSKFRVMAWPEVVNAQTFDGQAASYYATAQGLQSVNETAANALSTATAATTVANQALEAAGKSGFPGDLIWSDWSATALAGNTAVPFTLTPGKMYLFLIRQYYSTGVSYAQPVTACLVYVPTNPVSNYTTLSLCTVSNWIGGTYQFRHFLRVIKYTDEQWSYSNGYISDSDLNSASESTLAAVPVAVYKLN